MATKLQIYNLAETHLGNDTLSSASDDIESRYVFDAVWDGVVEDCFLAGDWNFAKKSAELAASGAGTVIPGRSYVFDYPSDYMRTIAVSPWAGFEDPFTDFVDEGGYIHSDHETLYLRYISDATTADPTNWPTRFWRYVAVSLAYETCDKLTNGKTKEEILRKRMELALRKAKSVDARNEAVRRPYRGAWLRARNGAGGKCGSIGVTVGGEIVLGEGDV